VLSLLGEQLVCRCQKSVSTLQPSLAKAVVGDSGGLSAGLSAAVAPSSIVGHAMWALEDYGPWALFSL
jgi:hypothetical protein